MDPLSITASIITVLGAAATIAKQLDLLRKTIQTASTTLCALSNEISDLKVVLDACDSAIAEVHSNLALGRPRIPLADVAQVIDRIKGSLSELEDIVLSCLSSAKGNGSSRHLSKLKWTREKSKAQRLQSQIREGKKDILVLLESHSA